MTARAGLPMSSRLLPTLAVPTTTPLWASILDDVWALFTDERTAENEEASLWLPRVDVEWDKVGVKSHTGKQVDRGRHAEIQGARVQTDTHQVGLSGSKTTALMTSTWWVLSQFRPSRRSLERLVGKFGFIHTFRAPLRASFGEMYRFLDAAREQRLTRTALPEVCWWELMEAACLAPLAQMELSAPWSPVVQCSDAAPGGHGLAYAYVGAAEAKRWFCIAVSAAITRLWLRTQT